MGCEESRPAEINGYTRGARLGSGAFGTVYKTSRDSDGQIFAEKFLPKMKKNSSKRELCSLKNLHHKNVVRFIDFFTDDVATGDGTHLIFEYCEGGTLNKAILSGSTDFRTRSDFRGQIADGTMFLHQKSIVHLDLKPDNILLSGGVCKITDFGIAKHWDFENEEVGSHYYEGKQGLIYAPLYYRAPELLEDLRKASPKGDVFSLGVMFLAMEGLDSVKWIDGSDLLVARYEEEELALCQQSEIETKIDSLPMIDCRVCNL